MEGPKNAREARQAEVELVHIRARHASCCAICRDDRPCAMADVYTKAIGVAILMAEAAKVVDDDGPEA